MRRCLTIIALASITTTLVARSTARCDEDDTIRRVILDIIAADNRGDLETVLSLYSEDAILLPPGEEPVRGRHAIEARYREIFSKTRVALTSRIDSVRIATDWAVARGTITGSATETASGAIRQIEDKFLMVLEMNPSGHWIISELMWSSNRRSIE